MKVEFNVCNLTSDCQVSERTLSGKFENIHIENNFLLYPILVLISIINKIFLAK